MTYIERKKLWRLADVLALICALPLVLWLAVPSSAFLRIDAILYESERFTIRRSVHFFASIDATWRTEIVDAQGHECSAGGLANYSNANGNLRIIQADPALLPCLRGPAPVFIIERWQVYLWGLIPLRPIYKEITL